MESSEFVPFPKIGRLNREVIITEKIDGSNAAIGVTEDLQVYAQSRKRIIAPGKQTDNYGFARFVDERKADIANTLGPGLHFGEWYGSGIQRGYGLTGGERYFALFNTTRWYDVALPPQIVTVPELLRMESLADEGSINAAWHMLLRSGSHAHGAKGFDNPEGIVLFHTQTNHLFKVTFEHDDAGKSHGA